MSYVDTREQLAVPSESFAAYAAIAFVNTTGEAAPLGGPAACAHGVRRAGGGFLGTHSATDTLYTWPAYSELLGTYFKEHPWTQTARVVAEDPLHPLVAGVAPSYDLFEEYYTFATDPRIRAKVLLNLEGQVWVRRATMLWRGAEPPAGPCVLPRAGPFRGDLA